MKVFIREAAVRDLDAIFDWIFQDSPKAAAEIVRRIHARIERLAIPGLSHIWQAGPGRGNARTDRRTVYRGL
jgi:plasmid stabilization system protein ParE